jgi:DNA-binding response OmpR family regulator
VKKILIIDDDIDICKQIKYNLQNETTEAYYATSVTDALLFLMRNDCCLIILELTPSETGGDELIHAIRKRASTPVLVLSCDGSIQHMERAYASGADDFLVKPFVTEECLLRSQALIRRFTELNPRAGRSYTIVSFDDLIINSEYRTVFLRGQEIELTGKEYGILSLLVSNPDRVYTYEQLFEHAWNDTYMGDKRRVITLVHRLRKKLMGSEQIQSIHDMGYTFKEKKENDKEPPI